MISFLENTSMNLFPIQTPSLALQIKHITVLVDHVAHYAMSYAHYGFHSVILIVYWYWDFYYNTNLYIL